MSTHTPTPWMVDDCPDSFGNDTVRPSDGTENGDTSAEPIATVYRSEGGEDNSAFIVRAVNSHAVMLAAFRAVMGFYGSAMVGHLMAEQGEAVWYHKTIRDARAAIAQAEGEA